MSTSFEINDLVMTAQQQLHTIQEQIRDRNIVNDINQHVQDMQ